MPTPNRVASLSLDLDNKWSYMKTHGDAGWQSFPSYLDVVVPRVLDFLDERSLAITFFIVGQDAALGCNRDALREIALRQSGRHEVGNHSFRHEPWLHLYSRAEIEAEIARAEDAIEEATGRRTIGFRGPGYSLSAEVLAVLRARGYEYDASTFPSFLGPLARAYYFMTARLTPEEREQRKMLFGRASEGLRPLKPYRWQTEGGTLVEVPVTTMPIFKVPLHVSYLLYLSSLNGLAAKFALRYFALALGLCAATGVQPSLLLHPLDFLGSDDSCARELSFFPAMNMPRARKLELVGEILRMLSARFEVLTVGEHAASAARNSALTVIRSERLRSTRGHTLAPTSLATEQDA
jgi:peptidoglycan-N-acetylglucosamine deacetylase